MRGLVAAGLVITAAASGVRAQTVVDPALRIDPYAGGFTSPSFFRFLPGPPGGAIDLLVCEIGHGRVLHYRNGSFIGVALDLAVAGGFERGLFGIAVHPEFATSPYVYHYYTASNTGSDTGAFDGAAGNRISRTRWNGSTLDSLTVLLELPVGPNHNGGALAFGPDGMLYGSIGEAGSTGGQLQNVATGPPPNDTSMIFRLRPDGTVPEDNPFFAVGGAMQKVYAYGLRNVFGIDFDPATGDLWCTDNGAATYDEIDRLIPGSNGGWKRIMGPASRDPEGTADLWMAPGASYVDPLFSFYQSFGITAIHFQSGTALGDHYEGDLFVAAHNSATVYKFEVASDRLSLVMPDSTTEDLVADTTEERDLFVWSTGVGVVTDIETGPDGALYLLRYSAPPTLYRISRAPTSDSEAVRRTARLQLFPNPFRTETTLRVDDPDVTMLRIFTVAGRLVRTLPLGGPGTTWDGRDESGRRLPAGVYLVRPQGRLVPGPAGDAKIVRLD